MTGYDLFLSNGSPLTTINVKTIDEKAHTSLILIGQGIPNYGTPIAQDFVWLMENFAKTIPPVNPLAGQQWYDTVNGRMNFYTGSEWRHYTFGETSFASKFDMASASANVDFTLAQTVAVFTGTDVSKLYCPTQFILVPTGAFTATSPATINFFVNTPGDVFGGFSIPITTSNHFVKFQMVQQPAMVVGAGTLNLQITTPASGGQLNYRVYVFGAVF